MKRVTALRFLVAASLLGSAILTCTVAAKWLSASAPAVRWRLSQTIRSLPAPPGGVELLSRRQVSESGSDCAAFGIEEIYGTEHPLEDIVQYYQQELVANGWTQLYEYRPGQYGAAGFKRGRDELFELLTSSYLDVRSEIKIPLQERLTQFPTVYVLTVTRTCGFAGLEQ